MAATDRPRTSGRAALLGLAAGITATLVAWGVLVLAAIDFGRDARGGATQSWYLLAGATIGAIACMFLAIIFAARLQARLKGEQPERRAAAVSITADDGVRAGDVAEVAPAPDAAPPALDDEPAPYRSRHSRATEGPAPEETPDSPAASYRGKRAAR